MGRGATFTQKCLGARQGLIFFSEEKIIFFCEFEDFFSSPPKHISLSRTFTFRGRLLFSFQDAFEFSGKFGWMIFRFERFCEAWLLFS